MGFLPTTPTLRSSSVASSELEEATRRHADAFGPTYRIKLSQIPNDLREAYNDLVVDRMPALIVPRERLQQSLVSDLGAEFTRDLAELSERMEAIGVYNRLEDDAIDLANAARDKRDTSAQSREALRSYIRKHQSGVDSRIDRILSDADMPHLFRGRSELISAYLVLIMETGAAFVVRSLRGDLDTLTKSILLAYEKGVAGADQFLVWLTIGGEVPPLPASYQMTELLDAILKRVNKITLNGFNKQMFDVVRDTIRTELYEAMEGGAGARTLARKLRDELKAAFGSKLPKEANNRLMLWARTEGAVVQNNALLKRGLDAGMNGKVWQTVGDSRVRDAHTLNEGDGVIPITDTFSDGSTDGGSGSVSPFNCRCTVGPAMLPEKKPKPKKPKT